MTNIEQLLGRVPFAILDGAMATELERAGFDTSGALWSARALADAPDLVRAVHRAYLAAGADIITTASYQGTIPGFVAAGYTRREAERLLRLSAALARSERDRYEAETGRRALVAASLGPYGAYLADGSEYTGRYGLDREVLAAFHRDRTRLLWEEGPDLLAFETIPARIEAEAIADVLAAYPAGCAWISLSCGDKSHTCAGDDVGQCAALLDQVPQVAAIGVNCMPPEWGAELLARLRAGTAKPLLIYPNSGETYDTAARRWQGRPADFPALLPGWLAAGARIAGGCCRTTPGMIRSLADARIDMSL